MARLVVDQSLRVWAIGGHGKCHNAIIKADLDSHYYIITVISLSSWS